MRTRKQNKKAQFESEKVCPNSKKKEGDSKSSVSVDVCLTWSLVSALAATR